MSEILGKQLNTNLTQPVTDTTKRFINLGYFDRAAVVNTYLTGYDTESV